MSFLGSISSKGGKFLGKTISKVSSTFNTLGNGMSKVLKGVNYASEILSDFVSLASPFLPELEPIGEFAVFLADTSKMGSQFLEGQSLTEVLKKGVPKLFSDEVRGLIPGASSISAASDLSKKLASVFDSNKSKKSPTLFDVEPEPVISSNRPSSSLLTKRSSLFDLQLN